MQVVEFETTANEQENRRLIRPPEMNHKDFMFMQKSEWTSFHRVIFGRWISDYHKRKEIEWWCNVNVKGRWFHSDNNEVYYFEDENSAIFFKLRWFSEIAATETKGN